MTHEKCAIEGCTRLAEKRHKSGPGGQYALRDRSGDVVGHLCAMHYQRMYRARQMAITDPEPYYGLKSIELRSIAERRMLEWLESDGGDNAFEPVRLAFRRLEWRLKQDRAEERRCKLSARTSDAGSTRSDANSPTGANGSAS